MQHISSQCTNCGAFTRRSRHHEEDYQSSALLERLRTSNFPPTDQEISHIHNVLPTISDDISSLDSKLASLHEVIKSMEEERERLQNIQKKYSKLISLQRALPSEIMSKIFLSTLPEGSHPNALDVSGSIWELSHVSQRWRNIALSLRSFWSNICILFPKAAQDEGEVERLQTVMERSRQGLLNITLGGNIAEAPYNFRIFDIILAELYRCRELNFEPITVWVWDVLYAQLADRFPRLERLGLHSVQLESKEQSVFENCPRLTKLTVGGEFPPVIELPWDQITELDLSDMWVDDEDARIACMRLIERCPSLGILSMPQLPDEEAYTPMTCSNIRGLTTSSISVIDALTIPRLRSASLSENTTNQGNILYPFKQLLIRSSCLSALTGLLLFNVPLAASPQHSLLSILSQTHNLTSLSLTVSMQGIRDASNGAQIAAIVNSLEITPAPKTVTCLPLLSSLDIRVSDHSDLTTVPYFGPVDRFASTLTARWKGDESAGLARLRRCHFTVQAQYLMPNIYRAAEDDLAAPMFSEAERAIFTALVENGMDLSIRVTSELTSAVGNNGVVFAVCR